MTSKENLDKLAELREEWEENISRERRIEIVTFVRDMAEVEMPESRCLNCKHTGVYIPHDEALIEGHCYSHDGMVEYTRISKVCEFCFDKLLKDPEEEPDGTGS